MNRRLGGDASLNAPIREEGDSGEWQDWLVDDSDSQEAVLAQSEELAAEFGVSRERVRQIEVRAFEKVQRAVKNRVAAMEARPSAVAAAMPAH